ncbi:enoyl-CoA hydratase/carnithine racemase [Antricoccus suffuscus]|uniref:Enoyl-CoA hydratase/carnithine racemase n=1 Tax=Antricoccus suffuscus TaxID=1629062 RepID=A0A2T0ZTN2_9ACTN|nr:enoyl-CoA hydratase/isomerase family protein [Antricoccus suffuscus]PRZ39712.1 enoyl-CoA hydratase/carnithine racemase [Antricoccus suffuscus]
MTDFTLDIDLRSDHVATIAFGRGANNFFDVRLISAIADALDGLAADGSARAVVLTGMGQHFCAGADLARGPGDVEDTVGGSEGPHLYDAAVRLFEQPLPLVAAVQGAAIGGGLGLALACDFRIASPDARFSAPFARLGVHNGFGTSVTLPLAVGHQKAIELLYTGRRVKATEAAAIGLVDILANEGTSLAGAHALAREIAASAPLAVQSMRVTMRGHLANAVRAATEREKTEQAIHFATGDAAEGIRADRERRAPVFLGR